MPVPQDTARLTSASCLPSSPCRILTLALTLLGLLVLLPYPLLAQKDTALPLPQKVEAATDSAWVDELRAWASTHRHTRPAQARRYAEKALALARDLNYTRGIGASLTTLGNLAYGRSDLDRAQAYYTKSQEAYEQMGDERALIRNRANLGNVHKNRGNLEQALTYYFEALEGLEQSDDTESQAVVLNNIGNAHKNQGNLKQALTYFERATALSETLDKPVPLAYVLNNYGTALSEHGAYEQAHRHLRRALAISKEHGYQSYTACISNNLGFLFNKQGRYRRALAPLFTAERLSTALEEDGRLLLVYEELGKAYQGLSQHDRALHYAHESLTLARQVESTYHQMEAHRTLSNIYAAAQHYEQSLAHHRQYVAAKDSIFNTEKTRIITQMQTRYETEEKKRTIESLQHESRIQALQTARWRNRMIAGVGALLLLSGFLFSRYRLKQRSNRLLEAKNEEIEAQRVALEQSLAEKNVLLREVHHRVKNNLQVISSLLNLQADAIDDASALAALRDTQSRVQAMALIHRRLHRKEDLPCIDMQNYIEGLSDFLLRAFNGKAQTIRCEVHAPNLELNADTAIPLGLILNELLSNALEHAFPDGAVGEIQVAMREIAPDHYELEVTDDGVGLPPHAHTDPLSGLGLQLVQQLSRQLEGTLQVKNGIGTRYTLRFTETATA